ncbi:MAG: hypothetical protein DHS20C05_24860 [Hyphococcus sp.]|nr:MAG: hypothetical protein DHS20C05_24860 [Marinicaulis sp.]
MQLWLVLDGDARTYGFMALDLVLAVAFFQLSRGHWFPVPLFFLNAVFVLYHLYSLVADVDLFWAQILLNRALEIELAYIVACSAYRIYCLRTYRSQI